MAPSTVINILKLSIDNLRHHEISTFTKFTWAIKKAQQKSNEYQVKEVTGEKCAYIEQKLEKLSGKHMWTDLRVKKLR